MPQAAEAMLERVRATGLLPEGGSVVVLLSGGRDSVCLLDAAVRLAGSGAVGALHVHHGLRADADADAEHCRALCAALGVALTVEHLTPPSVGNIQAWARDARHEAGTRVAASAGARLAAGHTVSDQVETILYRLAVSPGRRALLGMADERGLLIRPLLRAGLTRTDTAAWCDARGLAWVNDASNEAPKYARSRVRADIVPALRGLHPAAEANILRTASMLRDEAQVLDGVVDAALDGEGQIALETLASLPPALARLVVLRLAEDACGSLCPRAASRLDDLLAFRHRTGRAALDVGEGARAVVEDGVLRFERTPPIGRLRSTAP
ncbi:unannotated protein [freshwater metagenome]|uniref:tRNA(Ile)-lysidine synthetase n=1 Tax=freshwater metagenome TaxID=449393 RepID=A0A6J7J058_9ZZZZ|nr:tRNA lysidine(34) synthetase TilS [Actinomycetota bacterium]